MNIKGIIRRIDFNSRRNGKMFFYVDAPGKYPRKNGYVPCVGEAGSIRMNMPVLIEGELNKGYILCDTITPVYINDKSSLSYLTAITKGLNLKKSVVKKILTLTGKEVFSMGLLPLEALLTDNMDDLGIGIYKIAEICRRIYTDDTVLCKIGDMLEYVGVTDFGKRKSIANAILTEYGDDAIKEVQKDPYEALIPYNVSIIGIEKLALKSGIGPWSDVRILGLMHYAIAQETNFGHTYAITSEVSRFVHDISKDFPYYKEIPDILMSCALLHDKSIILCDDNPRHITLSDIYQAEKNVAKSLKALLDTKTDRKIAVDDEKIAMAEEMTGFTYGIDQRNAFKMLECSGSIMILTGGPGVGKTAFVNGITSLYHKYFPDDVIVFAAPTGRAAKRLSESVGYNAVTIHRLIECIPYKTHMPAGRNKAFPIEANFIIIDESSMIDVELMSMLLDAIEVSPHTKVLLVGDKDQLPSVKCGNVFADMIDSGIFPVIRLQENFRQDGEGSIVDNCERINHGLMPEEKPDFQMIQVTCERESMEQITKLMKENYKTFFPYQTQVIEPAKVGFSGCNKVNDMVHHDIVFKDTVNITPEIQVGDKIIFTRNEYTRIASEDADVAKDIVPLYTNGDMGVIDQITEDYIVVNENGEDVMVPLYAKNDMEMAYACTVHKFQGSEAETVIINLPRSARRMMTRPLLYTAASRARKKVILIYEDNMLDVALKQLYLRRTKLKTLLVGK